MRSPGLAIVDTLLYGFVVILLRHIVRPQLVAYDVFPILFHVQRVTFATWGSCPGIPSQVYRQRCVVPNTYGFRLHKFDMSLVIKRT